MLERISEAPITNSEIAYQLRKNPIPSKVLVWSLHGWPEEKPTSEYSPIYSRRKELPGHRDCLLWGSRRITLGKLGSEVWLLLYASPFSIVQFKEVTRRYTLRQKTDQDLENIVKYGEGWC